LFVPKPVYFLLHLDQLVLLGLIFFYLILVLNFYLVEVGFALIDLWWRRWIGWWRGVVDVLIISFGLHRAGACYSGRHVDLL
jgi:hypothetical protein